MDELATREKFNPVFAQLIDMVGAARDAFNRHSGTSLEQLKHLHGELTSELRTGLTVFLVKLYRAFFFRCFLNGYRIIFSCPPEYR